MQSTKAFFDTPDPAVDLSVYEYPRFSDQEYADRYRRVREWMVELELDCLLVAGGGSAWDRCWTNIGYLTNHLGSMELNSYCVFPLEGDPTVCCLILNATLPDRAGRSVVSDVRGGYDYAAMAADRIIELGLERGRIGIVELDFRTSIPVNHYQMLVEKLPNANLRFVTKEWWLLRRAKSQEEIVELERAAAWGDLAIDALAQARPGMTETELFALGFNCIYSNGADHPSMMLIMSTSMHNPTSSFQRNRPILRRLERGDIILCELGPKTSMQYEAQVGRPLTLGEPTREYRDYWEIAKEAYFAVADQLRPGKTSKDVFEAGRVIRDAGYYYQSPLIHGMYGVPADSPKAYYKFWQDETPFVPNQLLTIEIHVARPDRTRGIWFGSSFLLTENSPRCLSRQPVEIRVLDV